MLKSSCASRIEAGRRKPGVTSCVFDGMVYDTLAAHITLHIHHVRAVGLVSTNERYLESLLRIYPLQEHYHVVHCIGLPNTVSALRRFSGPFYSVRCWSRLVPCLDTRTCRSLCSNRTPWAAITLRRPLPASPKQPTRNSGETYGVTVGCHSWRPKKQDQPGCMVRVRGTKRTPAICTEVSTGDGVCGMSRVAPVPRAR